MQWTELILTVAAEDMEAAETIALLASPNGFYIEDYRTLEADTFAITHSDLIDSALLQKDRSVGRIHIYLPPQESPVEAAAFLTERLAALGLGCKIDTELCRSEDWENNWKAYFHPIPVGERLLIQPAWETPDPQTYPGRVRLLLEPGAAFGSGSHATTRLCLEALEEYLDQPDGDGTERFGVTKCFGAFLPAAPARTAPRVLDIGCGSGILTVAALLLGAERAVGVDIDPLAVASAKENGLRNGFGPPALTVLEGNLAEQVAGQFDVIVSNIVADAILALAPEARRLLRPGGIWISSGIIDTRAAEVIAGLEKLGWRLAGRRDEGGWVCLAAR